MAQPNNKTEITPAGPIPAAIIEKVLLDGDLSKLTPEERLHYYKSVCESLRLNPLTKPFDYIVLDKRLVLYARKDATEQLRKIHGVSITELKTERIEDVFVVTATAKDHEGRTDAATGAVSTEYTDDGGTTHKIRGVALANAIMKAETKAKRRVTLSICGLGMFDESELDTVTSPPSETILARNVREATAHATGEGPLVGVACGIEPSNEFGPLNITADNYKELKSHIGKAQGNMLGCKVGELHANVVEWMYKNWREKLGPSASDQDMRLSKAIQFAFHAPKEGEGTPEQVKKFDEATATPEDKASRQACITDLLERIEDLVLTEEQFMAYLNNQSISDQKWDKLQDMPNSMLLYLCTPGAWRVVKEGIAKAVKPKVVEKPVKKKAKRGKAL
jgi:hypothetical protein